MQTLMTCKLGFNQNNYTFSLMLLIKIVLCSDFLWTKFINLINIKCFEMRFDGALQARAQAVDDDQIVFCNWLD